jgi:hypothetical protein
MESEIRIPPPEEIKARIEQRREEIRQLKRLYQLSRTGAAVAELARRVGESGLSARGGVNA